MLDLTEIPIAASSRNVYLYAFAAFEKWLRGRPITDETIAQYLSYLYDKGKGTQSGEVALKAVRWRFLSEGKDDPRGKLCNRAIASYRRQGVGRGRGQVDGLTFEDVEKMVSLAVQEQTIYGFFGRRVVLRHVKWSVADRRGGSHRRCPSGLRRQRPTDSQVENGSTRRRRKSMDKQQDAGTHRGMDGESEDHRRTPVPGHPQNLPAPHEETDPRQHDTQIHQGSGEGSRNRGQVLRS